MTLKSKLSSTWKNIEKGPYALAYTHTHTERERDTVIIIIVAVIVVDIGDVFFDGRFLYTDIRYSAKC